MMHFIRRHFGPSAPVAGGVSFTAKCAGSRWRLVVPGTWNKLLYIRGQWTQLRRVSTPAFGLVFRHVLHQKRARSA